MELNQFRRLMVFLLALGILGCGQGNEPIASLGDASQSLGPGLQLPMSSSGYSYFSTLIPYSSSSPYWGLRGTFTGTAVPIVAPASGLVLFADTASQTVTILHNPYIESKLVGVVPSGITAGTYVLAGAQVGTVSNSAQYVEFFVIVNGSSVCPLSYLTSSARQQLYTTFYNLGGYNSSPCLQ